MPSTMAYRSGPLLWMTLPHMGVDVIVSEPTRQCASVGVGRSPHGRKRIGFNDRLRSTESHVRIIVAQCKLGENSKFITP